MAESKFHLGDVNRGISSLSDAIANIPTMTVVTDTKTTGSTGNIALPTPSNDKYFIAGASATTMDAYLRVWRATLSGGWYITAINPNTGATINNTQMGIRYLLITLPD